MTDKKLQKAVEDTLMTGVDAEILDFMKKKAQENRGIDANEMAGGKLPMLTLIQDSNSKVKLPEGQEPKAGWFYYKPKQVMIENPIVNIVYVKQCKLTTEYNKKIERNKSHYLVAGVLDGASDPFLMYIKGVSYGEVWVLFDQTRPWRKHKINPVLLSAFKIQLGSFKKPDLNGKMWFAVSFEMLTQDNEIPIIENDFNRLKMLDKSVDSSELMVQGIINKNIDDYRDKGELPEEMPTD